MTPDDEIREARRLRRFLATGEIEPRYDVRKECWAGSLAGPATSLEPGKEATDARGVFPSLSPTHD